MEITFAWFWLIKLTILIFTIFTVYKFVVVVKRTKKLTNIWLWLSFILLFLQIINPIKINGTQSNTVIKNQNTLIELNKVLPKKVEDTSFTEGNKQLQNISDSEIWSTTNKEK